MITTELSSQSAAARMDKLPDWQPRFWAALRVAQDKPFVWGEHDCILFGAGILDAMTGGDFVARVKAKYVYASASEAARLTPNGLQPLIEEFLGPALHPSCLTMGDLVLCAWGKRESLCVHDGMQIIGPEDIGLGRVAYSAAIAGWKL